MLILFCFTKYLNLHTFKCRYLNRSAIRFGYSFRIFIAKKMDFPEKQTPFGT